MSSCTSSPVSVCSSTGHAVVHGDELATGREARRGSVQDLHDALRCEVVQDFAQDDQVECFVGPAVRQLQQPDINVALLDALARDPHGAWVTIGRDQCIATGREPRGEEPDATPRFERLSVAGTLERGDRQVVLPRLVEAGAVLPGIVAERPHLLEVLARRFPAACCS